MKNLPYRQQSIVDLMKDLEKRDMELTAGGVGISFERSAMLALIKKGIVKESARRYKNGSHYTAYEFAQKELA